MDEKEMKEILEISPVPAAKGTILGEYNGKAVCMPEDTRLNRHIAVFGASGTMKSCAIIRNALFQALRRGESVIVTDSKELFKRSKPIRPKLKKPKVADTLLSEQKPK